MPDGTIAACTGATLANGEVFLYFDNCLPAYRETELKAVRTTFH